MSRILLILKGMCMGFADVVPGVSGGTMALILGIYVQFVEALKSLHLRWVPLFFRALGAKFARPERDALIASVMEMHLPFLVFLGTGIVLAFGIGSVVIPSLMESFPVAMLSFFVGLILASTIVPFRQMSERGPKQALVALAAATATFFVLGGHTEPPLTWNTYQADEALTLEDFNRRFPSVRTAEQLYCALGTGQENTELRDAIRADESQPGVGANLDAICSGLQERINDRRAYLEYRDSIGTLGRKHDDNPFNNAIVPAGTPVQVPAPPYWFIFIAGFIGICAMVLPGISGSFLLLIMGVYNFMLSGALKGFIRELLHGHLPVHQGVLVALFGAGCIIGILTFARVLSYLFRQHADLTLAAMLGLMLGSLRGIYPFRAGDTAVGMVAYIPDEMAVWLPALGAMVFGFAVVAGLTWVGTRLESRLGSDAG